MRPYSVLERIVRQIPDGAEWRDVSAFVVVDQRGAEVDYRSDSREPAAALAELLNDAYEAGEAAEPPTIIGGRRW
jgi:hypothetical protein